MKDDTFSRVAITKINGNINSAIKRAIELVGGMESVVSEGDEVYLKPNFVAPRSSSAGVTTDLEVIRVVAEEVRRCGGTPVIFETPAIEFDREKVYRFLGLREFGRSNGIRISEYAGDLVKVRVPDGKVLKSIKLPECLRNRKIINLPKLKTHVSAKMTCAMKNLIGLLPNCEKRRVHVRGVHEAIADICKVVQPVLNVVDAGMCMQGDGPTYGDAVETGLILASKDMVAVDAACCRLIGISPGEVPQYIRLSANGRDLSNLDLVGDPLGHLQPFRIPDKSPLFDAVFRGLYIADILWSHFSNQPLNSFLYRTGVIGTNPKIVGQKCNLCGDCLAACPEPEAIRLERFKIDYQTCIRCLMCYDVCRQEAIVVRGVSRPQQHQGAGPVTAVCERTDMANNNNQAEERRPTRRKSISVFFPALNEEGSVERLTRDFLDLLQPMFEQGEVIIVDDGSTDRTGGIADRLAEENDGWVRVIHHKTSKGYGNALKAGFEAARYDLVFFTDGDYQFDIQDLRRALPLIDQYDIVVGYRYNRQDPRHRLVLSRGYNLLIRFLLGVKLRDIDCSFKLFRRSAVDKIPIESVGYFVDTEIMVRGKEQGLSIKEIPVRHLPRTSGVSKIRMKHIYTTVREIAVLWKKIHRSQMERRNRDEASLS
jgi:uncharacterized protein (DUF362 family)/Pyruvate/2-oxoacid:ferredoxin oxidoreductase delta subunit